jgi:hypothetical protein
VTWKPDYITASDLAAYMRIDDAVDDAQLSGWVTAASRTIDDWAGRQFGQDAAATTRVYGWTDSYLDAACNMVVVIDDLMDATGLTVNGVAYASSGATLLPRNAPANGRPYTSLSFGTNPFWLTSDVVTLAGAKFGWTAVPGPVVTATKIQGARFGIRRESPYGVAGAPDVGPQLRLLARVDPEVPIILNGYARPPRAF